MEAGEQISEESRHRRLVSQVLVAGLIAVAYSEPVGPVTEAFDRHGVDVRSLTWLLVYVLTVLRFFIGNIIHLENPALIGREGVFKWFYDLSFIIAECVVLIFAGAVTTLRSSALAHVSFIDYLLILYVIDIIWLMSMQLFSAIGRSRHPGVFRLMGRGKDMAPFEWAVANAVLIFIVWIWLDLAGHPTHIPDWKLSVLLAANVVVFGYDLIDIAYGIREDPGITRRVLTRLKRMGSKLPTP